MIAAWVLAVLWPALLLFVIWRGVVKGRGPNVFGWAAIVVVSVAWGLGAWAFLWEPETLVVRRVEVVSPAWKGPPVRIGVIADIHSGAPHMSRGRLEAIVARMNGERPDVVALVGDFVGGHEPSAQRSESERRKAVEALPALSGLQAPQGVFAVLGNHDWWFDGPAVEQELAKLNIRVLKNSAEEIRREGGAFWVGGLADYESKDRLPSFIDTLARVPEGEPVFVMSHWPDAFAVTPEQVALVLAGHSHCGQVNLPVLGRLIHASEGAERWPCGLYENRGRKLYVTAGVGVSILPVRFNQPPEIALITLRRE